MEKVPQIVSERLKAAMSELDHPDADLLTAFSESSLSRSEHAAVVAHLARCGECREIVALALPASEPVQEVVRPANSGWLTWPVLRWGFIAAGIVAITSFGIARYQRRASMMAYEAAPPQAVTKEAKNLSPGSPSSQLTEDRDKTSGAPVRTLTQPKDLSLSTTNPTPSAQMSAQTGGPVRAKGPVTTGALPHGPRVQWQQNNNLQQQAGVQAAPTRQLPFPPMQRGAALSSDPGSVEVQSAPAALSANMDSSTVQNKIDQQALQNGRAETKIERSKPAATTVANVPTAIVPSLASPAKAQLTRQNAPAVAVSGMSILWTITAAGGLQRSLDQGTTWQDIDVNNPSAGASLDLMTASSKARKVASDSLAKKDASVSLVFRAVASNGPDVWAGASGGYLYHSTDAGAHWNRVAPSTAGVSLTGDIVSLEFVDLQHGRVVTSTPEIWTTSDGGQSWQKQ